MVNDVAVFPALDRSVWRSDWPYIVTLVDGVKLPAYPVRGLVDERGSFCFGDSCNDEMWYVADRLIEHCLITDLSNARVISVESVSYWEQINPDESQAIVVSETRIGSTTLTTYSNGGVSGYSKSNT